MSVLLLNASYEPLNLVTTHRAVNLVLSEKAEIVEHGGELVSPSCSMPKPKVIKLVYFVQIPKFRRDYVSNRVLFARDRWTCQYCGRYQGELSKHERLTRDHVKPVSRGGKDTWDNVVTSCSTCNDKKGDRLPYEAHMYPKKNPERPMYMAGALLAYCKDDVQKRYIEEWCGGR